MKTFIEFLEEMAFDYNQLENKITGLAEPIVMHMFKSLMFDDATNKAKHVDDIDSWLDDIQFYEPKAKRKTLIKRYHKWIFVDWLGNKNKVTRRVRRLHKQYRNQPIIRSDEEVYDIINDASIKIAKDVALQEFTTITDYIKELK